jgi:hypothetical protein
MYNQHAYRDQPPEPSTSPFRYQLRKTDTRSLYRQWNRIAGINVKTRPHTNIHEWLNPRSRQYNKTLADAVFHYSARASKEGRIEVCIATKDMREAAWKYGHHSQILMDGTFGICDAKILLFIVMGVDDKNHGIPLAFLLFSAPSKISTRPRVIIQIFLLAYCKCGRPHLVSAMAKFLNHTSQLQTWT